MKIFCLICVALVFIAVAMSPVIFDESSLVFVKDGKETGVKLGFVKWYIAALFAVSIAKGSAIAVRWWIRNRIKFVESQSKQREEGEKQSKIHSEE